MYSTIFKVENTEFVQSFKFRSLHYLYSPFKGGNKSNAHSYLPQDKLWTLQQNKKDIESTACKLEPLKMQHELHHQPSTFFSFSSFKYHNYRGMKQQRKSDWLGRVILVDVISSILQTRTKRLLFK